MSQPLPLPSERSFGTVFVVFFALVAAFGLWRQAGWWVWPAGLSLLTLIVTLARPILLRPLNRQWMRLALLLNAIFSPIILGIMFYLVFTPMALVMRVIGRDAMKRRVEPGTKSYWIDRDPPGPDRKSLPNQF